MCCMHGLKSLAQNILHLITYLVFFVPFVFVPRLRASDFFLLPVYSRVSAATRYVALPAWSVGWRRLSA